MSGRLCLTVFAFLVAAGGAVAPAHAGETQASTRWAVGGPGGWDYLTADAAAGRLYVTRGDHVLVLDSASGNLIATIAGTEGVHGVALDHRGGKGYASNGRGDSVTEFDLATSKVIRTLAVSGHNPDAIVFDAYSRHVFTFNGKSRDASVIDPATGAVVSTIALDGKPEFAVADGEGRIYVNDEEHAVLNVIDVRRNVRIATWPLPGCEEPSGLAFDAAHQRLFSVCANERMIVTDAGRGRHVATLPIGKGPDAVVFDAQAKRVFSSNGQDGTLSVIAQDGADRYRALTPVPTATSARTLALDARTQRLFLAAARFDPLPAAAVPGTRAPMTPDSFVILVVPVASIGAQTRH